MGGFAYSLNVPQTVIGSFVAVYLYTTRYELAEGEVHLDPRTLYGGFGALATVAVLSATVGLLLMKRKYWSTFISFQTGWELNQAYFFANEGNDRNRVAIFDTHLSHWKSIVPQVQAWTKANWGKWEETKPAWWTDSQKRMIPAEFYPETEEVRELRPSTIGEQLRRISRKSVKQS